MYDNTDATGAGLRKPHMLLLEQPLWKMEYFRVVLLMEPDLVQDAWPTDLERMGAVVRVVKFLAQVSWLKKSLSWQVCHAYIHPTVQ